MDQVDERLSMWRESLCQKVDVGGLISRNSIVHKWKAPFRSLVLRETLLWRFVDLLMQAKLLLDNHHHLGKQILIRSALETVAVLIYLNYKTKEVLLGNYSFHEFSELTSKILLGSKDGSTQLTNVNILTILQKADKKYPKLFKEPLNKPPKLP